MKSNTPEERHNMDGKILNPSQRQGKRNVFCPYYSECLDFAIRNGWMQWSCTKCRERFNKEAEPELLTNVSYSIAYYELSRKP